MRGTVKWYNPKKAFGFITREHLSDVFFHKSEIMNGDSEHINGGDVVEFDVVESKRGPKAIKIHMVREITGNRAVIDSRKGET